MEYSETLSFGCQAITLRKGAGTSWDLSAEAILQWGIVSFFRVRRAVVVVVDMELHSLTALWQASWHSRPGTSLHALSNESPGKTLRLAP
jgi:hypothetical protein